MGRYTIIFHELEFHAIISYYFSKSKCLIPPSETSRVYPIIRDETSKTWKKR